MKTHSDDPQQAELDSLRALVQEKEFAFRQAQERVNEFKRDWLYTSCQNFRSTLARIKERKTRFANVVESYAKMLAFVFGLLISPLRIMLRVCGLGRRPTIEKGPEQCRLKVGLIDPIPEEITSPKGNAFLVGGWVFHPDCRITHLELRHMAVWEEARPNRWCKDLYDSDENAVEPSLEFADRLAPVVIRNIPNRGVLSDHFPDYDANGNSFWSGFYALVTVPPMKRPARARIVVKAYLENGTIESMSIGKFAIQPCIHEAPTPDYLPSGSAPLIAVCMTTYNPPSALFRKQIESIRQQTHQRWICLIRDDGSDLESELMIREIIACDPRFTLKRNEENLGFYRNFEAVLADVPSEAEFIALSDQDDCWCPDKLETLVRNFTPGTSLVYSDMKIVDESGHVKADTYWTTRDNNFTHFPTLLLANTITGAASMFRRNLLDYLLPFPEKFGDAYHDHWLGCVAMAVGQLRYVDRPLYDYTQHSRNVVGHVAPKPSSWAGAVFRFCAFFWPPKWSRNINAFLRHGRGYYFADLLRIQHTARNVLLRCGNETNDVKHADLTRILTMADSWSGRMWLALRPLVQRNSWRKTVGVERNLVHAIVWRTHLRLKAWWGTRLTSRGVLRGWMARQCLPRPRVIDHIDTVAAVTRITSPLSLLIRDDSPARVNVVISIIDFKYVFGGYITVFHLCRKLVDQGFRVRIVVTDECDFRPVTWADSFRNYPGLEDFLDRIELIYAFDRQTLVPVSRNDVFLATSWWTAHIAHQATQQLGKSRFVYLIQEYEPGFYPYGSLSAFAAESYQFPHFAFFSTEILREFFQMNGHGVFATSGGSHCSASFQNAITAVGNVSVEELRSKRTRKLLFYCRPEPHALRNMFDTGLLALRSVVQKGAFDGWEFHGIGTLGLSGKIKLADGINMDLLPRLDQEGYRKILNDYDVGLSLMCSPHPSLVPLEMAKAGMWTVTNVFANKTSEVLKSISSNFIPTQSTVVGIDDGLLQACSRVNEFEARTLGAHVNWATEWDQAFSNVVLAKLDRFIVAAMQNRELSILDNGRKAA